ncbi:MAG: sensor domain-containing diguanylate cyclase [Proteobacteria bacterium]|nr:sensor domain-containing diguanylate cyclase [Pseudomonadota bacterium]MBU4010633.1 sensor domain-containing diguanylate cyclase [Pseudomonadota bacterium]
MTTNCSAQDGPFSAFIDEKSHICKAIESIQTGIMVIDGSYRVLAANRTTRGFFSFFNSEDTGQTCYGILQQTREPCSDCPITTHRNFTSFQKALIIKKRNGSDSFLKEHVSQWGENYIITMNNITREIQALRKTDFARKELQAKNVLSEHHRREVVEEKNLLNRLLDHLPDALVLVNKEHSINRKNSAVAKSLPVGEADTCYGLVGFEKPCAFCPAKDGFHSAHGKKTNHLIAGKYFTETIIESRENEGAVLIFSDTTRQIQLIEKIREQQETIARKNNILSNLVSFGMMTQKESDPKAVAAFFLDMLLTTCKAEATAVVVNDIRPGSLWFSSQLGFSDDQMMRLIRASLSERNEKFDIKSILPEHGFNEEIHQIHILGGDGRRVAAVFLAAKTDKDNQELLSLFCEPLGAYIHNRILMRRLEVRANTDTLTGLYNRRYLDTILAGEKKKYEQFDIPYAVVVADINQLKQVNDLYGHEAGDTLIITVASLLDSATRETDCVARTGGDEFVILLSNTTEYGAQQMISRLITRVFADIFIEVGKGEKFPVTVSFGAAGLDTTGHEELIQEADRRMYEAKESYYQTNQRY